MAKHQDTIIIISDDELDETPPIQHSKQPIQKYGQSKTNPINLDTDDNDQIQILDTVEAYNQVSTKQEIEEPFTSKVLKIDTDMEISVSNMDVDLNTPVRSTSTTSPMVFSLSDDPHYETAINILGLSTDVLEYINNQIVTEPTISMEDEPDWSFIAELKVTEETKPWEPPRQQELPTDINVPDQMCLNELFTRLDYYQHSMNQFIEGLQPKLHKGRQLDENSPSPTSSSGLLPPATLTPGRNSLKRTTTITQSNVTGASGHGNNKMDHQALLSRLLDTSSHSILQRPYVPVAVWQGSNWEDWAQFSPGDLIHVPFTADEDHVVQKTSQRMMERKRKANPLSLIEDIGAWSDASALLPGREPQDCCFRHMDITLSKNHLFSKPQLVAVAKAPSKKLQSYYNLLSNRRVSGKGSMNKYHSAVWKNLGTEITIGGGSGDASCLLLEGDPKTTDSIQVIAGSLCDDNQSYNMEGNLREWKSSTGEVIQMKGHFDETRTADGGTQVSWRTVHDIKTSTNKALVFSASRDKKAKIWNRESRKLISTLVCHTGPVHQISVKPGPDDVIATGSADGSGVIWKVTGGGKMGEGSICSTEMVDDLDLCSVECLEFGHGYSDNKLFMGYRTEMPENFGWITAFDALTADPLYNIRDMRGSVGCMALSQSGKYILSGNDSIEGGDQLLHVNDVMTGQSILKARTGHLDVNCVAFSRCDNYVASGSVSNQISIFDMRKSEKPVYEFLHDNTRQNNDRFIAPDAGIGISGMYWMKSNNILITAGGDCMVNLWDVSGGDGLLKSYKTADPISCLAVNEDLHTLAAGASGAQGLVHIWRP